MCTVLGLPSPAAAPILEFAHVGGRAFLDQESKTTERLARGLSKGPGPDLHTSEPSNGNVLEAMPDIVVDLGDDDVISDASGPSDRWTDIKNTRAHAVRTRQGEVHTEYVNEERGKGGLQGST